MIDNQPVSNIEWWSRDKLWANNYNPNRVAPPEWALLRTSLLKDGWTIPLVIRPDGEIVDGEHRWTLSGEPEVYALTDGLVPVSILKPAEDRSHQMLSTVRYNRARGSHFVKSMADIVIELVDSGLTPDDISERLGMEHEEIQRFRDQGNMLKRGSGNDFNQGWKPGAKG